MGLTRSYEYRACAGDAGQPMEDWDGPYETREEAEGRLMRMRAVPVPEYDETWIERRTVSAWERA